VIGPVEQRSIRIASDIALDRDVAVPMRDSVNLIVNVYRPLPPRPAPVVMSVTPYGKDATPDWFYMLLMRLAGVRFGKLDCSRWTGFESPDPLFWTNAGYVVVQADGRGMHKSEGQASILSDRDAEDYYELIEWAAHQSWSTGSVGLIGVSYLAMSQWRVAALRPPSLKAICPWEGVTDLLRELAYQEGVPKPASPRCGGGACSAHTTAISRWPRTSLTSETAIPSTTPTGLPNGPRSSGSRFQP